MGILTIHGTFGDYNILKADNGNEYKVYPYGIDFEKVYKKSGFFLIRESIPGEFILIQHLLD